MVLLNHVEVKAWGYLVVVPSSADFLNDILWVRFHGWYRYQSFINWSNIWGVDRTDPWGPELDHPPLGCSYLVVVQAYDLSCALLLLTGLYGWDSMAVIDINPIHTPYIGTINEGLMADIDINPSSMGPIFGVWIGPTLGVPKWTICHWAAAFWL